MILILALKTVPITGILPLKTAVVAAVVFVVVATGVPASTVATGVAHTHRSSSTSHPCGLPGLNGSILVRGLLRPHLLGPYPPARTLLALGTDLLVVPLHQAS